MKGCGSVGRPVGTQEEDSVPGGGGQGGFMEEVTLVLNLPSLRSYWADGRVVLAATLRCLSESRSSRGLYHWTRRLQGRGSVSCLETAPAIPFSVLGSHFPKNGKPPEMCCKESSQDSKGSGQQMSELLWAMCCPEKPGIRTQLLPPSNILPSNIWKAGSTAFSERVAADHRPRLGLGWGAVELTVTQVSAQSLTSGPPRRGLPPWGH